MIRDFILCLYALPSKYMKDYDVLNSRRRRKLDKWYGDFFYKLAERGIQNIMVFAYSNELYLRYTPWKHFKFHPGHLTYQLEEHNEYYWGRNRRIHTLAHKNGVRLIPVLFPGMYGLEPFRNNMNIVTDYYDDRAQRYQRRYLRRYFRVMSDVYGDTPLWASGSNEEGHAGNHEYGRQMAHRHHDWWTTIEEHVPLRRFIINDNYSDYVKADLIETHLDMDGYWMGHDGYDREIWIDWHGFGTKRDVFLHVEGDETKETFINFCRSHGFKHIINSDGATSGTGQEYCGGTYTNSTRKELNQLCRFIWLQPKFQHIVAELPIEPFKWVTLPNGGKTIEEDFTLLDFNRLNGLHRIWKEIQGK